MIYKSRISALGLIRDYHLPSSDIAKTAEVAPGRVSDFKNDRPLRAKVENKILIAIYQISTVLKELHPVRIDTRDPESVRKAFDEIQRVKTSQVAAETEKLAVSISGAFDSFN